MPNGIILDFQNPDDITLIVSEADFCTWATTALSTARQGNVTASNIIKKPDFDMTIRVIDLNEARELNLTYRNKDYATNVLSFPFEMPDEIDINLLGDIIICAPIVIKEAKEQHKIEISHWAHLTIHGTLHLLGFDHADSSEADIMEAIEVKAMAKLGFSDPYEDHNSQL